MPHSTIHLWVAKRTAEYMKQDPSGSFLLGSIVPDAINIKVNVTSEDKQLSHLRQPDFSDGYENARKILREPNCSDFLRGCATHIMLDDLWLKGTYLTLQKQLGGDMSKKDIDKYYKKDCEYIEMWLFRQNNSRLLWNAVMNTKSERYFDILTPGEIDEYRKSRYIKLNETKIRDTAKYFNLDTIRRFMDSSAKILADEIKQSTKKNTRGKNGKNQ